MSFVRSYFFANETLGSCPFLSSKLDPLVIKALERHIFYMDGAQCPRIDLNKRFLPRPNTTTA
jgi:hypothetical protein